MEAPPCKDYQTSYTLFSTFREEPSAGVGTAYVTADTASALCVTSWAVNPSADEAHTRNDVWFADKSSRHAGKRLGTQPLMKGRNPDVWFDKDVRSLADGDVYMDPMEVEKKLQQQVGGKQVTERAFFPPKNSKKRCDQSQQTCMDWPFGLDLVAPTAMLCVAHSLVM